MGESRLSRDIQSAIRELGGFVFKVHGSEYMMAGLPDLIICYRGLFFGIEIKQLGNKPTERQVYVGKKIMEAGGIWAVVTSVSEAINLLKG